MTISSTSSREDYIGNGATATYSYGFRIFNATELLLTVRDTSDNETTLVKDTDYTVDTVAKTITLTAGNLTTDYVLTIRRVLPLTQPTQFRNIGDFHPESHENMADRLCMEIQQVANDVNGAVKIAETLDPANYSLRLPIPAANLLIGWDDTATVLENKASAGVATLPATPGILCFSTGSTFVSRTLTVGGGLRVSGATGQTLNPFVEINDGGVSSSKIKDLAVSGAKIGASAVTAPKIAADAVTAPKIAASAVGTAKIDVGAVTNEKIGASAVTATKIASDAVTTPKIQDAAVTPAKMASGVNTMVGLGHEGFSGTSALGTSYALIGSLDVTLAATAGDILDVTACGVLDYDAAGVNEEAFLKIRVTSGTGEDISREYNIINLTGGSNDIPFTLLGYDAAVAAGLISGGNITVELYGKRDASADPITLTQGAITVRQYR
jgi:hypothetical protein